MKNKVPKERIIFDNYDVSALYEAAKELLTELAEDDDEPTENEIWNQVYFNEELCWKDAKTELTEFFNNISYIGFFGKLGRWTGIYQASQIDTDFWKLFNEAVEDCDYVKIYDENGHMYLTCSHHDGTNHFEIKEITDKGYDYLEKWQYDWDDKRTEQYIHSQIFNRYSKTPRFVEKVYGCKRFEYEPITREVLKNKLANEAWSRYSA